MPHQRGSSVMRILVVNAIGESHSQSIIEGMACPVDEADLPLELPDTEDFTPKGGEGPCRD